ncbi:MAG: uracil-DNA glycosylase family protein [Nocardioidaceae bacterium]
MAKAPGAEEYVPERPSVRALRTAVQDCQGCDLYRDATQAVMGDGPAGRVLDKALAEAGIEPDTVWRTNVVKHFRFEREGGKRRIHEKPGVEHVNACRPWLLAELDVVRPTGVVLLGATAAQAILGRDFRITKSRGVLVSWPAGVGAGSRTPGWVLPTVHPSSVVRSPDRDEAYAAFVDDLRVAAGAR